MQLLWICPVSYTHVTLPTVFYVLFSVVAVALETTRLMQEARRSAQKVTRRF